MYDSVEPKMIDVAKDILAAVSGGTAGSTSVPPASEATQAALLTELQLKRDGTSDEPVFITCSTQMQTPTLIRSTTSGTIAAGAIHISVTNTGSASGTVLGTELKSKETIHFTVTDRNATLSAIPFVATGTELVITTLLGATGTESFTDTTS